MGVDKTRCNIIQLQRLPPRPLFQPYNLRWSGCEVTQNICCTDNAENGVHTSVAIASGPYVYLIYSRRKINWPLKATPLIFMRRNEG